MECASFEHFTSSSLPSIKAVGPVITHFWAGYIITAGMQHSDKYGADQLYETEQTIRVFKATKWAEISHSNL